MYAKEKVLFKILEYFATQRKCADALKMSEANFSKALRKPSTKFIAKLRTVGIKFENTYIYNESKSLINEPEIDYDKGNMGEEAKKILAKMQKQIDAQTQEINKWKAETLDLKIRNEQLENKNEQLRVQYNRINDANKKLQYHIKK